MTEEELNSTIYNGIKTIVVLTDVKPNETQNANSLLKGIKDGRYAFVPADGKIGNNPKRLYAVFNMSVETAKGLCRRYRLSTFVYTELMEDDRIHSEYYEKTEDAVPGQKADNTFIMKEKCHRQLKVNDASEDLTVIGTNYQYSIPHHVVEDANRLFIKNIQHMIEVEKKRRNTINEDSILDFAIHRVGLPSYLRRDAIIKGFYDDVCK